MTFTVNEHLLVEQLEGKADDFGNYDFLLFKVRDLKLNQLLMVYKDLNGSYESPLFTCKRQLKTYLTDYSLKHIGLMKLNEMTRSRRFRQWASSMGENYQWNSGFLSLNSNLVSNMEEVPLCKNLATGVSYLLKNNCA